MAMAKKHRSNQLNFTLFTIFTFLTLISFFILKESNFNKPIPGVVEIPKEVQESIKNVKPQKSFRVPILLYHYVEYVKDEGDTIRKSLNIVPFIFEQQIKTLKNAGISFITTADLANALDDKASIDPKSVILTFDDGYRDFYTDVFPILKKYQVKAVVYIVPNFLDLPNNLTTWQLKEIAQSPLVEIGAHTMNHAYLSGLPLNRVEYEVKQSKEYLESNFEIKVTSFAYPYGAFDNQTIGVVKKAGFKSAVTAIYGVFALDVNKFFLYRIRPGVRTGDSLLELFRFESLK
ncbi:polysaccharide deacetylase family protein [Patescibacteria group bacterium]|nr:polysaccharide deacetylase family protein [Patescibacteria group bacterium]